MSKFLGDGTPSERGVGSTIFRNWPTSRWEVETVSIGQFQKIADPTPDTMARDEAYRAAEQKIEAARRSGATELDLCGI